MKIISCVIFISFLTFHWGRAQNLVPNPSFEDTVQCPTFTNQLAKTQLWVNPTQGTPEYYNACSTVNMDIVHVPDNTWGNQFAYSGNAYAGIYTYDRFNPNNAREYLEIQLANTLTANHKYLVSFYASLADNSQYAVSSIGAYFSNSQISTTGTGILSYTPQIQNPQTNILTDKNNWILISDTLYAEGAEQYITIGNFNSDSLSDTLALGFGPGGHVSYYYIDSVSVVDNGPMNISDFSKQIGVTVYPNPTSDVVHIETRLQDAEIKIRDVLGNEMLSQKLSSNKQVDIAGFPNGVYFLRLLNTGNIYSSKFIKE